MTVSWPAVSRASEAVLFCSAAVYLAMIVFAGSVAMLTAKKARREAAMEVLRMLLRRRHR
ncbi:hypothetical protein [Amycolatopsis sp. NPDC004378]